ncbi:MAG: hypothetical protein AVDCRST_MAG77-2669, partial [uncultured Chloroflexi bacterium]
WSPHHPHQAHCLPRCILSVPTRPSCANSANGCAAGASSTPRRGGSSGVRPACTASSAVASASSFGRGRTGWASSTSPPARAPPPARRSPAAASMRCSSTPPLSRASVGSAGAPAARHPRHRRPGMTWQSASSGGWHRKGGT